MGGDPDWSMVFDHLAPVYAPTARYSAKCMDSIVEAISSYVKPSSFVLDAACGTAYPSALLAHRRGDIQVLLADLSFSMIRTAIERWPKTLKMPCATVCDLTRLPFPASTFDAIMLCCAVHLVADKAAGFNQLSRSLRPGGVICIVTYDPLDVKSQVFHRFFPRYQAFDENIHIPISSLNSLILDYNLFILAIIKFPYDIIFDSAAELIAFVKSRPFSTFWRFTEAEFEGALRVFSEEISKAYPSGAIHNSTAQTLIIARKYATEADNATDQAAFGMTLGYKSPAPEFFCPASGQRRRLRNKNQQSSVARAGPAAAITRTFRLDHSVGVGHHRSA
jgi:ubiquinone/menaquinone biosynthesis C-methylase UbiE